MNFETLMEKSTAAFTPAKALTQLALDNTDKLLEINIAATQANAQVWLSACKSALDIKDAESAKAYFDAQRGEAEQIAKRTQENAAIVIDMVRTFTTEAQKVMTASYRSSAAA